LDNFADMAERIAPPLESFADGFAAARLANAEQISLSTAPIAWL
jgi:hypothetical protein